jgi:adenylate cyclase class IV
MRTNEPVPKESFYLRVPTSSPGALREALGLAYGQVGRVVKHRTLYLRAGRACISTTLKGSVTFWNLKLSRTKVNLAMGESVRRTGLMSQLGVDPSALVDAAYVDLLSERAQLTDLTGAGQ